MAQLRNFVDQLPGNTKKPCPPILASLQEFFIESEVPSPRRKEAARALHMSDRTLSRRLQAAGTTYQKQLHLSCMTRALAHFETGASVKKTAYALGFRDPSAFSHAFKRWTGQSAREYQSGSVPSQARSTWLDQPPAYRVSCLPYVTEAINGNGIRATE